MSSLVLTVMYRGANASADGAVGDSHHLHSCPVIVDRSKRFRERIGGGPTGVETRVRISAFAPSHRSVNENPSRAGAINEAGAIRGTDS
jgi:hypothetical protein